MIDKNYYMTEACGYFALALNELFGYQIQMLIDDIEQEDFNEPVVAHVFCINDQNQVIDVMGKRNVSDIKKEYYDLDYPKIIDVFPEELKSEWMGNDKPLFPYSKQEVEDAKSIILENKELFIDPNIAIKAKKIFDQIAKFADRVLFKNYDHTDDDPNGPGIGLFNGPMDRFKSVDEFRKHKAMRNRRKKKIKDLHDKVSR